MMHLMVKILLLLLLLLQWLLVQLVVVEAILSILLKLVILYALYCSANDYRTSSEGMPAILGQSGTGSVGMNQVFLWCRRVPRVERVFSRRRLPSSSTSSFYHGIYPSTFVLLR